MEAFIFATSTGRTTSIPPPLKTLSTYEERLASLLIPQHYSGARRRSHTKAVLAAAGFSGGGDPDPNYTQCTTCSLLLYNGYCTPEPLKKHLRDAPHCSLAQQLQQEVASKNIVAKPKIEPPSAPPVKFLGTYEDRLASLDKWRNVGSKEILASAGFSGTDIWFMAQCTHCSVEIFGVDREEESLKYHLRRSPQCPLALQLEKETPEAIAEAAKPTPVAADIGFFDASLACDIQEFSLFCEAAGFVQQLRQCQPQYRESDLLALLSECFRGPALTWYKQQSEIQSESETVKKSLSEWLEALATAFPAKPPTSNPTSTHSAPSTPPPQYHSCLNCSASFSSLTRLLQHTQEAVCKKAVCKHCEGAFDSKNKLHEHLRQHHTIKEVVKDASGRSFNREGDKTSPTTSPTTSQTTPPTSPKTTTKTSVSRPVTPPERPRNPPTPPATPAAIAPATPKRSHLPLSTPKLTAKPAETESVDCPLTPLATPPPRLRKPQKPHLTIDDLVRMFRGKPRPFGLQQHQKRSPSPQSPGARSYQSRITAYFLPATNQKAPTTQGLKSPKPKSFQQPTPAESLPLYRPASALPEKSTFSPYKMAGISYTSLKSRSSTRSSFLQSRSPLAWPRPTFPPTSPPTSPPASPPSFRSPPPDHVCCTCFDRSSFRNGLFDYQRLRQRYPSNRRPIGEI